MLKYASNTVVLVGQKPEGNPSGVPAGTLAACVLVRKPEGIPSGTPEGKPSGFHYPCSSTVSISASMSMSITTYYIIRAITVSNAS